MTIVDPRDIPGLRVWYSAQALSGFSEGALLSAANSLVDQSGNGRHASPGGTLKYNGSSGPAGGAALEFFGAGSWAVPTEVFRPGGTPVTEIECFTTIKVKVAGAGNSLWSCSAGGGGTQHYTYSDGNIYEHFFATARPGIAPGAQSVNNWRRYNCWSKTSDFCVRLDENVKATGAYTISVPASWAVGGGHSNWHGYMTSFIVYNRKLTTTERSDLATWLAANPSGGTTVPPGPALPDVIVAGAKKTVAGASVIQGGVKKPVTHLWVVQGGVKKTVI